MIAIPDRMDKISKQHQGLYLNPIDHGPVVCTYCDKTSYTKAVQIFQVCG